jgi:hypothetical protein
MTGYVFSFLKVINAKPITAVNRPNENIKIPVYQLNGDPDDDNMFPASSKVIFPNGVNNLINCPDYNQKVWKNK